MKKISFLSILVLGAILVTIAVNILANALPLNGQFTGEISDRFSIFFVPAGYVFSIWGLIYLLLIGFAVYQALPASQTNPRLRRVRPLVLLAAAANTAWVFFWHYNFFSLTLVAMLVLLASLLLIYLRLEIGKATADRAEFWLVQVPHSVYLGWITVATIANFTQVLFYYNWNAWGLAPQLWAVILLAATAVIGGIMAVTRRDAAYLLVLIWAIVGIAVKFPGEALLAPAAWAAAGLQSLWVIVAVYLSGRKRRVER